MCAHLVADLMTVKSAEKDRLRLYSAAMQAVSWWKSCCAIDHIFRKKRERELGEGLV